MATSSIPDAIDSLVDQLQVAPGLADADVVDGPMFDWAEMTPAEPQRGDGKRWVVIGAQPDLGPAADGTQEFGGSGGSAWSRDERFRIYCCAIYASGDQDVRGARHAVFDLVAVVEEALTSNPGLLGEPVLYAEFAGVDQFIQSFSDRGTTMQVLFSINCRAYLTN